MSGRRTTGSVGTNRVTKIRTTRIGGLALAGAVAAAVAGGSALHALAGPGGISEGAVARAVAPPAGGPPTDASARTVAHAALQVPDVPWLVERGDGVWLHGRGSRPGRAALPSGETGLAVGDLALAASVPTGDGRSTVRFRDPASGRLVGTVDLPIWVSAGAWTSVGLVVTGYGTASMASDGGLVLVTFPGLSIRTLVAPHAFQAALGTPVARGDVVVSPSGRVVASNACGVRLCDTQVVDLATSEVFHPIQSAEGFLRVITDDVIVTTDDEYAWVSARHLRDGTEAWRRADSMLLDPLAAADGSVVGVVGSRASGWGVAAFDRQGRTRDLTPRTGTDQPWPRIWRQLSTPTTAVVGREGFEDAVRATLDPPDAVVAVAPPQPVLAIPVAAPSSGTEVAP